MDSKKLGQALGKYARAKTAGQSMFSYMPPMLSGIFGGPVPRHQPWTQEAKRLGLGFPKKGPRLLKFVPGARRKPIPRADIAPSDAMTLSEMYMKKVREEARADRAARSAPVWE